MPTKYTGSKREARALDTYIKLMRATETVTARLSALIADQTGLTTSQFGVLEGLLHLGPMCQKEIAAKQLKSGGNITLVIDNLEKRGLVRRQRSQQDRRLVIVHLTGEGEQLIRTYFPHHARAVAHELGVLTAPEQEQLAALTKKLGLQLGRKDAGCYPADCFIDE
ncbi:MAG: MarR family transcriptional regulator [Candidatus Latescibacteria bacterium]|nr:MarR family transcriptional regulator [Candidatus Latescibacterota bacterium]